MELVINFSGGKDSCMMLAYLCEQYPDMKKHVVFADTGWEHKDTEAWCRYIVNMYGLPLHVVRSTTKTFLTMVEARGMFPGEQYRQCTSDLKRGPIQKWIRRNCGSLVINCMGLRAEESADRAKKQRLARDKQLTNSRRTVWNWLPIQEVKAVDVFSFLASRKIPLHPVYGYLKRFSCRVCIFMSVHELQAVQDNDPEAIQIISALERKINFSLKRQGFLDEILQTNGTQ